MYFVETHTVYIKEISGVAKMIYVFVDLCCCCISMDLNLALLQLRHSL